MDAAVRAKSFAEVAKKTRDALRVRLSGGEEEGDQGILVDELYLAGREVGLTPKEIVIQLCRPVASLMRPGYDPQKGGK